jgi:hypothetical protein
MEVEGVLCVPFALGEAGAGDGAFAEAVGPDATGGPEISGAPGGPMLMDANFCPPAGAGVPPCPPLAEPDGLEVGGAVCVEGEGFVAGDGLLLL